MNTSGIFQFVIVGFLAQMIDGALGMAYGVCSTTFLLSLGIPPAAASASVHAAEVVTSSISGLSHLRLGNVEGELVKKLLLPGVVGGIHGAYVLTSMPTDILKPAVSLYLLVMGLVILRKSREQNRAEPSRRHLFPLGLVGGFCDAVGGGGWGPIVTSTLVATGNTPRLVVGSVNLVEFFVTVCESMTFFLTIGLTHANIIVGLIIGGGIAAPAAAYVCKRLPVQALMRLVGLLIVVLSARTILLALLG
jgi:uncharacterized membrane protein YfcA